MWSPHHTWCTECRGVVRKPPQRAVSGSIGFADLAFLLSQWGPCVPTCTADLDGSGDVGFGDLTVLLSGWGACG